MDELTTQAARDRQDFGPLPTELLPTATTNGHSQHGSATEAPSHHHHPHDGDHSHTHGAIDPTIASSSRGLWAIKWSFVGLAITAAIQALVFILADSIALLADLIHNIADASTAIPLGLAFLVGRRPATRRFSYGFGRAEDLAGVAVVAIIAFSALITGYESVERLLHPHPLGHLGALTAAGLIGFVGNGAVSLFRIRVGREIGSAALVADGYHARADSLVSLAVVVGALGVGLGFPQADPLVGLLITAVLFHIVWDAGKTILTRMLDGVDPDVIDTIQHAVEQVPEVETINHIRARWLGHRLYAEVAIGVSPSLSIQQGDTIGGQVQAQLHQQIPYLARAAVQIGPSQSALGHRQGERPGAS